MMITLPGVLSLALLYIKHKGYKMPYETINAVAVIVFFIILFLILALRNKTIGVDTANYIDKYHKIGYDNFSAIWSGRRTVDIGYGLLNKILSTLGVGDRMFLVIISLMMVAPIAWLYSNESDNWLLTVSIFVVIPDFAMLFSGLRQGLAISIVPIAYYFAKKKNLIGFLISVLIAFSFHSTALFLLILYPAFNIKIKTKWLFAIIPVMALAYIFNNQLYALSLRFLGGKFEERYSNMIGTGAYTMLFLFMLMAVLSFVITDENKMDPDDFGLRNILLLIVMLQFFAPVNSVAMRMNYYFLILLPIIMPRMIACSKDKFKNIALVTQYAMAVFFLGYFYYKGFRGKESFHIFPYKPFWKGTL